MIEIHPEILKKDDKEQFAILDITEFQEIMDYIEELEDLLDLKKAKLETKDEPSIALDEVRKIVGV